MSDAAHIVEVFSGIQGEGTHVGRRQLFVRFAGCNLACAYCDTPASRTVTGTALVECRAGSRTFRKMRNPMSAGKLAAVIVRLDRDRTHDSISLTGGEPLLAADFIAELIPLCDGRSFYLETNGTLPREMRKVVRMVRTVAMDIKLASASGQAADLKTAREFLRIAVRRDLFVKAVVSDRTTAQEIRKAASVVAAVSRDIPLVIQPVTPTARVKAPSPAQVLALQSAALDRLTDVRVIPQIHKLMGQR